MPEDTKLDPAPVPVEFLASHTHAGKQYAKGDGRTTVVTMPRFTAERLERQGIVRRR